MMTERSRIIANAIASYGRSLVALALGLFSARWILEGLGQSDFGLYGVVGGIIVFITFLNTTLSGAISRFFAYAVGRTRVIGEDQGKRELNEWFNTALCVHSIIPFVLVVIGYPIGSYAIQHWLVIPDDRLTACLMVFRFSVFSAFIGMVSVPYTALFTAFQLIFELSFLNIAHTIVSFLFAYSLLSFSGDRLVYYAEYMMGVSIAFTIGTILWAHFRFKMCRLDFSLWFNIERFKSFFTFAGAKFFGAICVVLRTQGGCLLLNRFFLPQVNAAYSISMQVSSHTSSLSQALVGALQPAVANREGGADREGMLRMAETSCRMASLLVVIVAIPMLIEIEWLLVAWLKNVPYYAITFCACMVVLLILDKMSIGYMLAANAYGKKMIFYELTNGILLMSSLPISYIFFHLGYPPYYLAISLCFTWGMYSVARVVFCRWQLGVSMRNWVFKVALPVIVLSVLAYLFGSIWKQYLASSFLRVVLVTCTTSIVILFVGPLLVLSKSERKMMAEGFAKVKGKFKL